MLHHRKIYTVGQVDRVYLTKIVPIWLLGISVDTLQEHEGSVAVSAFTSDSSYGCILPTPALSDDKLVG
jgi:hypothetical protein